MAQVQFFTNVPPGIRLQEVLGMARFKNAKAEVIPEDDGEFTVVVTFPDNGASSRAVRETAPQIAGLGAMALAAITVPISSRRVLPVTP